jgi:hypothetical protein
MGPAELELIAFAKLAAQIQRDLAILESLDRQRERTLLGRRRDRIAALRLISVVGGEAYIDVLPSAMAWPAGHVETQRWYSRRLLDDSPHGCNARRSHRSPTRLPP